MTAHRTNQPATSVTAFTRPFVVEAVVFTCGAVGMVLELVGSRLLAPYFGNSLFVWTSLIGVMLGFMALGNFLGGRLADRHLSGSALFLILAGASAGISLIAFSEGVVVPGLASGSAMKAGAVAAAIALFAIPSTILGMVAPYSIRLRMHAISDSGSTVGGLYALSTLGSIVGTFAAGFWLITVLGSHNIILWIAAAPAALSLMFIAPFDRKRVLILAFIVALLTAAAVLSRPSLDSFDTQYDRYFIRRGVETQSGRPVVGLTREVSGGAETLVYADNGEPVIAGYSEYYDLALGLTGQVNSTLLIGGGAFAYPRHQLSEYPDSSTEVVEIDPALIEVARSTFFLKDDPRMHIVIEDGRTFLNKSKGSYDAVLLDAFKSRGSVPYQLATRESMVRCYGLLNDHGVLAMNLVGSFHGPGSAFVRSEYATLKSVFPHVEVFGVTDPANGEMVQNISLIAFKDADSLDLAAEIQRLAPGLVAHRLDDYHVPAGTRIITDDFAPVDQYILGI